MTTKEEDYEKSLETSPAKKAKLTALDPSTRKPSLQSLKYVSAADKDGPSLEVLDQLLIPEEKVYIPIKSSEDAYDVIKSMQIRGAPLIAIVALLGLAVDVKTNPKTLEKLSLLEESDLDGTKKLVEEKMEYLKTSRPTAVNLFNAMKELKDKLEIASDKKSLESETTPPSKTSLINEVVKYAEYMLERDVHDNECIGKFGADAILGTLKVGREKARVVTICNTGSLATAHYGTALGVVRELSFLNKLESITALETRPYNQGSRLTAFEIVEEGFPGGQLICDSMAAYLMKTKGVDACVVGADRVCANGDTANKIGTYNLSIVAKEHNLPFYVAAPFTTLDITLEDGSKIPIEERPAKELLESSRAPSTIQVWNPAFDVTPATFITGGIITEKGVITDRTDDGSLDVTAFVHRNK